MPWYAWCPERLELIAGRPRVQCVLHQCDSARVERGARRWAWPTAQLRENRRRVHAARPPAHLLGHCEVLEWKFYYLFCYLAETLRCCKISQAAPITGVPDPTGANFLSAPYSCVQKS